MQNRIDIEDLLAWSFQRRLMLHPESEVVPAGDPRTGCGASVAYIRCTTQLPEWPGNPGFYHPDASVVVGVVAAFVEKNPTSGEMVMNCALEDRRPKTSGQYRVWRDALENIAVAVRAKHLIEYAVEGPGAPRELKVGGI